MSFSLRIENNDIQTLGSNLGIIYGTEKLKQDLDCWLKERYRGDRFHLSYGSTLDSYIGDVVSRETVYDIQGEVLRVLQNYQALQYRKFKSATSSLSMDEILMDVLDVKAEPQYDKVIVVVKFVTGSNVIGVTNVSLEV